MVYRLVVRVRLSLFTLQKVGRLTTPSRQFARTTHYNKESYKLVVVGGGTGGCATAARFCRRLGKGNVAVIEPSENRISTTAEDQLGYHQTTAEQIFIAPKHLQHQQDLYHNFIDFINAFIVCDVKIQYRRRPCPSHQS